MNKDRVEGKVKDLAGRAERQTGEWTGNTEAQVKGAAKQAEGKVQNAWGKAKDAANQPKSGPKPPERAPDDVETEESRDTRRSNG